MITSAQALKRYGPPEKESAMVLFAVPLNLKLKAIPSRIYCNRDLVKPLTDALLAIRTAGFDEQIKTWDGCFNIRKKRGAGSMSLHSWGLAIDINAAWNRFGATPTMSEELVACFEHHGFEWGGRWARQDGMHFQLKEFPK